MRHILIAVLVLLALATSAFAQTSDDLDAFIARHMASSGAPGLAYAFVDGESLVSDASGVMRSGENAPVTPHTLFRIGSVTKSFTALAIVQLAEAGQLTLDDEVASHLPVFETQAPITLRQLLSHTSGYSTVQGNAAASGLTLSERGAQLAHDGPAQAPGTGWAYSNANYQMLGAVIEAVSGQTYPDYVESNILRPAGMHDSHVLKGEPVEGLATGHRPWMFGHRPYDAHWGDRVHAPSGGIVSSAADMALYLSLMLNGEDDLVSAASKAEMVRPASEGSPYYGLGWALDPEGGYALHTGLTPGFETIALLEPAQQRGVVVLINASGGMGFGGVQPLLFGITNLALGEPYEAGAGWGARSLYLLVLLMPLVYLAASVSAWVLRDGLRAKSGIAGIFSLWFPLVMSGVLAVVLLGLLPRLFGTTLGGLALYQPDFVLLLYACVITSAIWAVLRLMIAHTGPRA
ncbi:MAG: serine hydrolase [Oceanicaulis sp.]|uniref:serine hydrolase domain-containing protein n=1 Tax=Oceanicaulis sp. UBA2681 TaxID=1947007 RepID=UPI000C0AD5C7|nr:serine hydrolase domain-containing protein [Oceanicaulis sp. UBA2681]MAP48934.1 serine hydrolase [Oceanicaulis sp.]|tara:strand:- start:3850 stop:5235 length:1386 start_codon:yes stop_codon:yes gene_type:complete